MANMDQELLDYVKDGGTRPETFRRGLADAGRFGQNGEMVGIGEDERADYHAGVCRAIELRDAAAADAPVETGGG